jgi:PBP1b-binding outer membrane lipoprotein LpoB
MRGGRIATVRTQALGAILWIGCSNSSNSNTDKNNHNHNTTLSIRSNCTTAPV